MPESPLTTSLIAVSREIQNPIKTAENPHFRSKFAPLCEILTHLRPLLSKHRLVLIQSTAVGPYGPVLVTKIRHESGEEVSGEYPLSAAKNDPQGIAGAVTYARRYAIMGMLGIAGDNDDDGTIAAATSARKSGKVDMKTGEVRTSAVKRTEAQTSEAGKINSETLRYAGEKYSDEARAAIAARWKEYQYTEDWPTVVRAMGQIRDNYYAIAVNEQRA